MRLTKKVMALAMASCMAMSLAGCGGGGSAETTAAPAETTTAAAAEAETTAADAAAEAETTAADAAAAVEGKDPSEIKVGISIYQFADNFMTLYREELQRYLVEECGLKAENISVMDGKNDQGEQMNQIRNFITQGYDVMIINLVQASSEPTVTEECNAAGIPVVYINREPEAEREEAWVTDR